jgi:single-strand DNA-binding protein
MVRGLNKVMVIGHVGRAPEMRYMPSGRAVTAFSVGTPRSWEDVEGDEHQETEWFNVVAWGELAERCKGELQEDDQVYVEGQLQTRSWKTNRGDTRFRTELLAKEMLPLNGSPEADTVIAEAISE